MKKSKKARLRILLLLLALAFLLIGSYGREYETVFAKASKVCLECIGIG